MTINRANSILILMVLVGFIIWFQFSLLLLHEIFNYHLLVRVFNYGSIPLISHNSKLYSILSLCMNIFIVYSIVLLLWRIVVNCMKAIRWNQFLKIHTQSNWSYHLMSKYADLQTPIIVIPVNETIAFSTGFLRPKIILSTGILDKLNESDLRTTILNQYNHCKNYSPLRSYIAWLIKESLPFFPIQRGLFHYFRVWLEVPVDPSTSEMTAPKTRIPYLSISSIVISIIVIIVLGVSVLSIGS